MAGAMFGTCMAVALLLVAAHQTSPSRTAATAFRSLRQAPNKPPFGSADNQTQQMAINSTSGPASLNTSQSPAAARAVPVSQYGVMSCGEQDIILPTSTADVSQAVQYYYGLVPPLLPEGWPGVKLRVASRIRGIPMPDNYRFVRGFAERPGFSCPTGPSALTRTAVIATSSMRQMLKREGLLMTVQAGMTQTELIQHANSQNLTLPLGTLTAYNDLTVGGMLATGAHAQGPRGSSNLVDIVTSMTFVDGTGRVHHVERDDVVGRGLAGGLGMLGIITEVTFKLQQGLTKTKVSAIGPKSDDDIEEELPRLIDTYKGRVFIWWRPDQQRVKYVVFEEQPDTAPSHPPETAASPTQGGAIKPLTDSFIKQFAESVVAVQNNLPTAGFVCKLAAATLLDQKWAVVSGNPPVSTDNVTALTNNLQGTDCTIPGDNSSSAGSCWFDFRTFQRINAAEANSGALTPSMATEEAEFALPQRHLHSFLTDIKALARQGLQGACWPPSIIFARPAGSTPDLISPQSGPANESVVWFELGMFRANLPAGAPSGAKPRFQKRLPGLQEAWEQLLVCKYGARPHWGKVWSRVFKSTACPIRQLYPNFSQQLQLQKTYDPAKLFETSLLSAVIAGGSSSERFPACTNEMMCYCQTDEHCGMRGVEPAGLLHCKTAPAPLPPYRVCLS